MIEDIQKQCGQLREPVDSYTFTTPEGEITLNELFGQKRDLLIIHNMGRRCSYCTMWADGLNGLLPHLENRAAVALSSPDDPVTQRDFAQSRGWRFRMISAQHNTFNRDMGFAPQPGSVHPGVSAFHKMSDGSIVRTARAEFGPGDEFCAAWHLFALLHDGASGWEPQFSYS